MSGFVGRRRELEELEAALGDVSAGRGRLVLVSGEAGIGKTKLCEELAERASARGVTTAWARCWEAEATPPFWPWEQLLGQLPMGPDQPASDPTTAEDPELARLQFFDGVGARLRATAAATAAPLLLVLDDLHWADVGTVRLLDYLAPSLRAMPVLVVATGRDGEPGPGTDLGDAILALARLGPTVRLAGLGRDELPDLVRWVTSGSPEDVDAAALHHLTGGNPLFAQELVRLLDSQGALAGLAAGTVVPVPVPDTVRGVLARRLGQLSGECRSVLEAAAVVGDQFGLGVVQAVTALRPDRLLELIGEGMAVRVLRETGVAEYAFAHPLVRAILHDELGVARRARLHEQVGAALERRRAAGHDVDLAALAHHFAAAGSARAVRYAVEAAEAAMHRYGYENAVHLYQQALASDPPATDRCAVLLGLGAAQVAAGNLAAARQTYVRAADLARGTGRADQLARAALGVGSGGGFEVALADREQIDLLEEARIALGPEPSALHALVAARLSVALSLSGAEKRQLALSEEAVSVARASGDRVALAYALSAHCDAIAGPAGTSQRLEESAEIVALATATGDRSMELLGRRLRVVALLELGQTPSADSEIEAYARLAGLIRQPLYGWYVPLWRGLRALMRGELDDAVRLAGEAAAMGAQAQSGNAAILAEGLRWYVGREGARAGAAEQPAFGSFVDMEPVLGVQVRVLVTLTLADVGALDQVRARLDADAVAIRAAPVDSEWVSVMVQLVQAIAAIGTHPLAEGVYGALLPHRHLFGVEGIGCAWSGSLERPLGLLAAGLGRVAEAAAHFDAAVAANRAAGSPLFVARTLLDAGVALGDRHRLAAALEAYRDLGIEDRVAEVERLLGVGGAASNVFRCEGDVWELGYAGHVARVKDAKGLRDLAILLAEPGREVAAVDLAAAPGAPRQRDLGQALDDRARDAYKARLAELEAELERADAAGDAARSARVHDEHDALVAQLAAAYGLGGRPRRLGDTAERARQTVSWRIRDALKRIERVHPDLAGHLRRSVRTGAVCVYQPTDPVDWSL